VKFKPRNDWEGFQRTVPAVIPPACVYCHEPIWAGEEVFGQAHGRCVVSRPRHAWDRVTFEGQPIQTSQYWPDKPAYEFGFTGFDMAKDGTASWRGTVHAASPRTLGVITGITGASMRVKKPKPPTVKQLQQQLLDAEQGIGRWRDLYFQAKDETRRAELKLQERLDTAMIQGRTAMLQSMAIMAESFSKAALHLTDVPSR
jgi:hypothetical protein